ncbi:MAG: AraC family transcriptional regulator [Christensenellales bacterium]|jgi:hypothetical protein
MKLCQLADLLEARTLCPGTPGRDAQCGYVCDLLSWVMARGQPGMAWITVQTHLNVIAVAALHEMACVILPDGLSMEQAVLDKAGEEGVAVLSSPHPAYEVCGRLYTAGLMASPEG